MGAAKVNERTMDEPRKIDVAYADSHWLAEIGFYSFDCPSLMHLIATVQRVLPDETMIFVVDQFTVEDYVEAEAQFAEATRKSEAVVISTADI